MDKHMKYSGEKCPVCNVSFASDSDIVVCPDCGTPHHRECYEKTGKCKNFELHQSGFVYTVQNLKNDAHSAEKGEKAFPAGDFDIDRDADFPNSVPNLSPYGLYDREPIAPETDIGGVYAKEYRAFLGSAVHRYLPRFVFLQKTGRKVMTNLFAFFFPFTFAAHKRMYKVAAILLALNIFFLGLGIYSTMTKEPVKAMWELLVQVNSDGVITESEGELLINAANKFNQVELERNWMDYVVQFKIVDNVLMGLFGTYLYMKESEKKIKTLRETEMPEGLYETLLARLGKGVYAFPVMGYIVIMFVLMIIVSHALK